MNKFRGIWKEENLRNFVWMFLLAASKKAREERKQELWIRKN